MLNRKLLEILSRLNPTEHRKLRLFLQSPYFNNSKQADQLLALYEVIMAFNAADDHPALQKESVSLKFFPDKPYREKEKGPLDSLTSQMLQLVRQFMGQLHAERITSPVQEALPMLQFYRKWGLEERFWQTAESARKAINEILVKDARYFLDQFQLEEEISTFQSVSNTYEDDANINSVNESLDNFFSIVKLEYACAFYHQYRASQIDEVASPALTNAVIEMTRQSAGLNNPLIKIYLKILDMLSHDRQAVDLIELEELLVQNEAYIPADKFKDLQTFYRVFWVRQYMQSGENNYRDKIFEVFEKHLLRGYLYFDDRIAPLAYRNLLNLGLKLGKFEWVKNLLESHPAERIGGTRYPNEVYSLNLAEYHFYKKEYDESIRNLTYRPFENPNFSIFADVLLIKIYYETEDELLDSRMKALDQKVRRTKLSKESKEIYFNFLKKLDKIIKYGWQKDSPKKIKLIAEIKSQPNMIEREWLLEQLG